MTPKQKLQVKNKSSDTTSIRSELVSAQKQKLFLLINGLEMGGAERAISNIADLLADSYEIILLTLKKSEPFFIIGKNRVEVRSLSNTVSNSSMLFLIPKYAIELRKIVADNVGCHLISFLDISNIVATMSHPSPIISMRNSPSIYSFAQKFISKLLMRKYYPKSFALVVNSVENKYLVADWLGLAQNKIEVIYNPLALDSCKNKAKEKPQIDLSFAKGKKVFITVSRLESLKNIDVLIDSFVSFTKRKSSPRSVFIILGDGPMRSTLEAKISRLKLSNSVYLLGAQKNVFPYLSKADVFVFASRTEGFPNVLLEAMAMGLPLVTTNFSSGSREVIDPSLSFTETLQYPYVGPNGILVDLHDMHTQFPRAFEKALSLKQKNIGVERFAPKKIKEQWLALLLEASL